MNSTNENDEHLKLIQLEEGLIVIFFISLGVSFLLNYNNKLKITNRQTIWTNEEAKFIAIINSVVVVAATIGELYSILKDRELILRSNGSLKKIQLTGIEIFIGIAAVIISFMELYVIINSDNDD